MPPSLKLVKTKDSIEERRARGELSCAECRRHKLKCDRNIPCSTCVRKGCQSVCPNGTVPTTPSTNGSYRNIVTSKQWTAEMRNRIRQLEDALQVSHSLISPNPHPLLEPDLLDIKNGGVPASPSSDSTDQVDTDLLESFGTLAVSNGGTETYLGSVDPLLAKHMDTFRPYVHGQYGPHVTLPTAITNLSKTFPFSPLLLPEEELQKYIESNLPSYGRASALIETYLENTSWFFRPVDRQQIVEELLPSVYKRNSRTRDSSFPRGDTAGDPSTIHPHALSLVLAVFAVGAAADLTLPPWNDEADLYYHLARAALGLKPVFEGSGLHAVQAVGLLGAYDLFSCRGNGIERSWKMLSISLSLAASIGLNRDPSHFDLSPKLVTRRRRVFWELLSIDLWKSFTTGRPLTFHPDTIDCGLPDDPDVVEEVNGGQTHHSIWWLRYRFVKDIMLVVISKVCALRTVKYAEILALDQKIREYDPEGIGSAPDREQDHRRSQLAIFKDSTLMFLHRVFFSHALIEDPENPMRTRFAPSFLSTYRSASSLVTLIRQQLDIKGHSLVRIWPVWAYALTGLIALGSIAQSGSASALAPQAFAQFIMGYEMVSKAQMHPLIKQTMLLLDRLREQARKALLSHGHKILPLTIMPRDRPDCVNGTDVDIEKPNWTKSATNGHPSEVPPGHARYPGTMDTRMDSPFVKSMHPAMSPSHSEAIIRRNGSVHTPMLASVPAVDLSSEADPNASHSPSTSYAPPQRPTVASHSRSASSVSDFAPFAFSSPDMNGGFGIDASSPFSYPSSPTTDPFGQFTSLADMSLNSAGPSGSFSTSGFPLTQDQEQTFSAGHPQDLLADDLTSLMSTGMDFDVSFDMRSFSGQENVLPLLPENMAWRSFLEDSNFFGKGSEILDSEKGSTP